MPVVVLAVLLALFASFASAQPSSFPTRLAQARARFDAQAMADAATIAEALRGEAEAAGDRLMAARAARVLGNVRLVEERFADATRALSWARDTFRAAGARQEELETELLLARVTMFGGDVASAEKAAVSIVEELERLAPPREAMLTAYSQALSILAGGDDNDRVMARALAILEPTDSFPGACSILQSHGDDRFNAADYTGAHEYLTRALTCYRALGQRSTAGRVLVSLGRVQRAHGQLHAALDYYMRAAAEQKAVGDIPAWLQSLNAQAVTYDRLGQFSRAETLYRRALGIARAQKLERYEVFLQGNLGGSLLSSGRPRPALPELEAAATRETNPETRAIRHRQLCSAYADLGMLDKAATHLETAQSLMPRPSFDDQVSWLAEHARLLARQGELDAAQRELAQAVKLIEDARQRVLSGDTTRRGYGELHQAIFAASIDVSMRKGDVSTALELAEQARARALLDLMHARAADAAEPTPHVAQMQALARALDSTLLVYWVQQDATFAWVVTPEALYAQRLSVGERQLRQWIRAAAGSGDVPGAINAALLGGVNLRPWRALHRALVAPLIAHLPARAGARLTIVPHGPLLHLPFAGLLDARGRYLVERYAMHYSPSVAVLQAASQRNAASGSARALVLGDPAPLPRLPGVQLPPPLPRARQEARDVVGHFPGGGVLSIGAEATEKTLRSRIGEYAWLHVATHARVAEEATAHSYLLLARGEGTAEDDGLLTEEEVKSLPLHGTTVVLSACGTALGRVTGEGTLGFTRSFLAAGARAIVATTWEMPDVVGLEMMNGFYAARDRGLGVSDALRSAQLQQLQALRTGKRTRRVATQSLTLPSSPLLWAGYVAVGVP